MLSLHEIFSNFILPALIAAAGLVIGWWPPRRKRDGRWIAAIAVSGAFIAADCAIGGTPHWPPGSGDAAYWIIWFAMPTALLGLLDAIFQPPTWLRAITLLVLARIAAELLLAPLVPHEGSDAHATLWSLQITIDAAAMIAVAWWLALETLAAQIEGSFVPVLLTIVLAAGGAMLAISNNIKPAQATIALTGMAAIAAIFSFFLPLSLNRGAVLAFVVPLLGLLLFVHFYSYTEPPPMAVALFLAAPLLAFAGDLPGCRKWTSNRRWTLRLVPVILALAAAAGLTARQFLAAADDQTPASSHPEDL